MNELPPALTWLYVPGDRPDRFEKAVNSETDVVVIDLEDAVAPTGKDAARANARSFVDSPRSKPVIVRVNDLRSPWGRADLETLSSAPGLGGLRLPKVESAADVHAVVACLKRALPLDCLIETARGVEVAFEIASAPGVARIGLGEADLRSDLGASDDDVLLWSRGRVVVAARAAGLSRPAMSVYANVADLDGLAASCARGRALGFLGRAAIHPRQLPVIVQAFTPSAAEIGAAREVLDAVETGDRAGVGVIVLPDGRFVDRAMVEGARLTLALASRAGGRVVRP
ncbi:MAG TPA: CoA ester lyase [Candidatus Acidoferrales bacterium]|nr:CoA ester lyase [Candidatus Acidoferrales bacterium]